MEAGGGSKCSQGGQSQLSGGGNALLILGGKWTERRPPSASVAPGVECVEAGRLRGGSQGGWSTAGSSPYPGDKRSGTTPV